MKHVLLVALLASYAGPATAFDERKPARSSDPDQQVCKRYVETGSRLRATRVCATRAEWAEIRAAEKRRMEELTSGRAGNRSQLFDGFGRPSVCQAARC